MAGQKTRRGEVLAPRKRYVTGTSTEVKRAQLKGVGRAKFVWISNDGVIYSVDKTELR